MRHTLQIYTYVTAIVDKLSDKKPSLPTLDLPTLISANSDSLLKTAFSTIDEVCKDHHSAIAILVSYNKNPTRTKFITDKLYRFANILVQRAPLVKHYSVVTAEGYRIAKQNQIIVDTVKNFAGLECACVIVVDEHEKMDNIERSFLYAAMSRAMSKLVIITTATCVQYLKSIAK